MRSCICCCLTSGLVPASGLAFGIRLLQPERGEGFVAPYEEFASGYERRSPWLKKSRLATARSPVEHTHVLTLIQVDTVGRPAEVLDNPEDKGQGASAIHAGRSFLEQQALLKASGGLSGVSMARGFSRSRPSRPDQNPPVTLLPKYQYWWY